MEVLGRLRFQVISIRSRCIWIVNYHPVASALLAECAGVEYDDNKVICCGDKLYEKTEYSECCFGEMMDTRLYACFFGKLPNPFSSTYLVQQF